MTSYINSDNRNFSLDAYKAHERANEMLRNPNLLAAPYKSYNFDGNRDLISACINRDLERVNWLLDHGADVNFDDGSVTPLTFACTQGDLQTVKTLIAHNVDIHKKHSGRTSLHEACQRGHYDVVQELLLHGAIALIDEKDSKGDTPLMEACRNGHLEIYLALFGALLTQGLDADKKRQIMLTAFHSACSGRNLTLIQWFLDNGFDAQINSEDRNGMTALHHASKNNQREAIHLLIAKGADFNKKDKNGASALHLASFSGSYDAVQELLKHVVVVDLEDNFGQTPFMIASGLQIAEALLAKGADIHKRDHSGMTALFHWARTPNLNSKDCVKWLLERGAKADVESSYGQTPLMYVARDDRCVQVVDLLARGVNVNKKDKVGKTALHMACLYRQYAQVKKLLKYGAEIEIEDYLNNTPLSLALALGDASPHARALVIQALLDHKNAAGQTLLHTACIRGDLKKVAMLVAYGARVDIEDKEGWTPLLSACHAGSLQIAQYLLGKGANVNKQNRVGDTALSLAQQKKTPGFVKLLLEGGIQDSYFLKFKGGTTPLHTLFQTPTLLEPEALATLFLRLMPNFDVTCKNNNKKNPLGTINPALPISFQLIKLLFRDFGAIEKVVDSQGKNFLPYFNTHPEELISHPQNLPTANPLALAMLFDSKTLAHVIAQRLTTDEFLAKVQALEMAFPKSSPLTFLFEAFISLPVNNHFLLPQVHIQALFSYLCKKIDIAKKNEGFPAPLRYLLLTASKSEPQRKYAHYVISELLGKFEAVKKRLSDKGLVDFLSYFTENPETLLQPDVNPLEVAFLFDDIPLARALVSRMTDKEFQDFSLALEKSFPKSETKEFLFNVEFSLNQAHFAKGVILIPEKPAGIEVRDLLKFFEKINFLSPHAPDYYNPENYRLSSDPRQLKKILEDFIVKIETRKEFRGTPKKGTEQIKAFYKIIENAVTNTIKKLQEVNDDKLSAQTIIDYLRDVNLCGGKIFPISVEIFYKVVHNVKPDFENRALTSLGELRGLFARDVIPAGQQSVHDYNKFIRVKGKKLGIPGSEEGAQFDDIYVGSDQYNPAVSELKFLELYLPFTIHSWLETQLKTDAAFRERYAEWWKGHAPKEWNREKYDPIRLKVAEFREQQASLQQMEEYLESQDIYLNKALAQTPEAAIEDAQSHAFIESEVYEDMASNTFKKSWFAQSLVDIAVLARAPRVHYEDFLA